jgi:hypothetical protein
MKTLSLFAALFALTTSAYARNAGTLMTEAFPEFNPDGIAQDAAFPAVNWAQPPLGCVEEMVPHRADSAQHPCPDFSQVAKPSSDWPANMSASEKAYWYAQRRGVNICRSEEILRREKAQPGSQGSLVELAWMAMDSLNDTDAKIQAIYDANRISGVPLHVLTGAVYQESLFSELGIADDGGNYSCGVEQINLIGWCEWMNKQPAADRAAMGWPTQNLNCNDSNLINLSLFKPIYQIALTRLNGLPEYRLVKQHFQNIPLASFVDQWPAASAQTQALRYQLITSYINNCSDPRKGILAKANELANIYNEFVPDAMKKKDRYGFTQHFNRKCQQQQAGNEYPLHTGWLMAVSAYNAGPRSFDALAYYNHWDKRDMNDPDMIADLVPTDIVTSLYWSGKYNPQTDDIDFMGLNGSMKTWTWFKGCVAQRHIARVMQHVTLLPEFFVDSLEGSYPCARTVFDASHHIQKSAVPDFRQKSSGVKDIPAENCRIEKIGNVSVKRCNVQ